MLEKIEILEQNKDGIAYDCDTVWLISRLKKGAIASNHTHDEPKVIFFMEREVNLFLTIKHKYSKLQ